MNDNNFKILVILKDGSFQKFGCNEIFESDQSISFQKNKDYKYFLKKDISIAEKYANGVNYKIYNRVEEISKELGFKVALQEGSK